MGDRVCYDFFLKSFITICSYKIKKKLLYMISTGLISIVSVISSGVHDLGWANQWDTLYNVSLNEILSILLADST